MERDDVQNIKWNFLMSLFFKLYDGDKIKKCLARWTKRAHVIEIHTKF
jgi:hypothetical protein